VSFFDEIEIALRIGKEGKGEEGDLSIYGPDI